MKLLSIREAAEMLDYTEKGLRKIVERSRAKAAGARTRGPTIKFFQTSKGAPIKFRPEWIEEFIDENTVDPSERLVPPDGRRKRAKERPKKTPLTERDRELLRV
jgi:hypothetical protein